MKEYIFRDPVHGNISVVDPTVLALIQSPEFQRLRRIRQLGTSFISYPGAEHTRFAHSLGVYHLMGRVLRYLVEHRVVDLAPEQIVMASCAALLHDVGHGPFSHLFEKLTGLHHETWTERILMSRETQVNQVLTARDAAWPGQIAAMIRGDWKGAPFLKELLSSQLDVDRMDYLLRDARMCGVTYGQFDLDRLVQTITVIDGRIALTAKGLTSVEEFILARYFMYWNVYFHKATRSIEVVLERLLQRALDLLRNGADLEVPPALRPVLLPEEMTLRDYLRLDETDVLYAIKRWTTASDPILADLSDRFINRRLFAGIRLNDQPLEEGRREALERLLRDRGFDPAYYLGLDLTESVAYKYYVPEERADGMRPIQIQADWLPGAPLMEVSQVSHVLKGITDERKRSVLFLPREVAAEARWLLSL
jgi:HD superfamily phosphohydrolase